MVILFQKLCKYVKTNDHNYQFVNRHLKLKISAKNKINISFVILNKIFTKNTKKKMMKMCHFDTIIEFPEENVDDEVYFVAGLDKTR